MTDQSTPTPKTFKSVSEVIRHLREIDVEVSDRKVYDDVKKGLLQRDPKTGKFSLDAVEIYVSVHLAGASQGRRADITMETIQKKKLQAEAEKAAAQARHWQLRADIEQGRYIERVQYEQDLSARAAVLRSDIQHFFTAYAAELIQIIGGDHKRIQSFIDYCHNKSDEWLDRYSKPTEWEVPAGAIQKEEEPQE